MCRGFRDACRKPLQVVWAILAICLIAGGHARAQAPAPAASRTVNVGLYVSPPFVTAQEGGSYSGMAIDLWDAAAVRLNLATHYVTYPTFRDLVEAMRKGDIDAAVTNLTITSERAEVVSFTQPWFDAGLRIMVPDRGAGGFWSVVTGLGNAGHLRAYAWLLFVILAATLGLTVFDRRFDPDFPKRWREGFAESFYQVIATAMTGRMSRSKNLFGWMGRIWSAIWMVCGIAVIAYITSSVTSVMTAVSISQGINSLADLPDRTVGVFTGSVAENYVTGLGIASRPYPDIDVAVAAMKAGEVDAIVGDAPILEYYAHGHPEQKVAVVGNIFHPDKYGFAFPHDSDLARPVTLQILDLHEDGTIAKLRLKYFGSSP
ncbi:transporter substrate-binding domain-containing protein [Rhizobium puerariae]|uniref:Transporter substrate-binding domain-containing protein n=1 Tax=Rhizobium puerariae TaxID=1585791 RepID=A0ABV6ADA7_9HYPH